MGVEEITAERRQHLVSHLKAAARRFSELRCEVDEVIRMLMKADDLTAQVYDDAQGIVSMYGHDPDLLMDALANMRQSLSR